jgi:hypothetical protein
MRSTQLILFLNYKKYESDISIELKLNLTLTTTTIYKIKHINFTQNDSFSDFYLRNFFFETRNSLINMKTMILNNLNQSVIKVNSQRKIIVTIAYYGLALYKKTFFFNSRFANLCIACDCFIKINIRNARFNFCQ